MQTAAYLAAYLDTYITPRRAPSTVEGYMRAFGQMPESQGQLELTDIDPMVLQCAINHKAVVAPRAAQLLYAYWHAAFARAVRLGKIARNPMSVCDYPEHDAQRADVLTCEQVHAYIAAARHEPCYPLLLLMATCALRRGEVLGLLMGDIDLQGRVLHIRQQRIKVCRCYAVRPCKSRASKRDIPISDPVRRELIAWLDAWPLRSINGYVYDTTPDALYHAHKRAIATAGVPYVTPHGLRHSVASSMAATGTPIKVLQALLGHSRYQLTADLYADHIGIDAYRADMATFAGRVI